MPECPLHEAQTQSGRANVDPQNLSIFEQSWWLDAATGEAWSRAEARWDNKLVGWMPYFVTKHWGLPHIAMPPYTRTLAPRLCPPASTPAKHLNSRIRVLRDLLGHLPRHDRFE